MSYCTPYWMSDYTYQGVLDFLAGTRVIPGVRIAAAPPEPVLLVWGHMRGGELMLEPAFEITARATLPAGRGAYTVQALDASGTRLFSYAFDARSDGSTSRAARATSPSRSRSRASTVEAGDAGASWGGVSACECARVPAAGLIARLRGSRAEVGGMAATFRWRWCAMRARDKCWRSGAAAWCGSRRRPRIWWSRCATAYGVRPRPCTRSRPETKNAAENSAAPHLPWSSRSCHARRHWNSASYRTAAGINSGCGAAARHSLELYVLPCNGASRDSAAMELRGLEPLTSAMRMQRSPS